MEGERCDTALLFWSSPNWMIGFMPEFRDEFRGVPHLGDVMAQRGITTDLLSRALTSPDRVVPATKGRLEYRLRYFDEPLHREMVLRVIVEPHDPMIVVTAMKTSKIAKYPTSGEQQ